MGIGSVPKEDGDSLVQYWMILFLNFLADIDMTWKLVSPLILWKKTQLVDRPDSTYRTLNGKVLGQRQPSIAVPLHATNLCYNVQMEWAAISSPRLVGRDPRGQDIF